VFRVLGTRPSRSQPRLVRARQEIDRLISPGSRRPAGVLRWLEVIEPTQPFRMRKKAGKRRACEDNGNSAMPTATHRADFAAEMTFRQSRPPWRDTRAVLNGILWVLGTGAQGRELSTKYPPYQTGPTAYSSGHGRQAGAHLAYASRRKMTDCWFATKLIRVHPFGVRRNLVLLP
jgi:transposase